MPHLATTYAAVNTLITFGSENALSSIDRLFDYTASVFVSLTFCLKII